MKYFEAERFSYGRSNEISVFNKRKPTLIKRVISQARKKFHFKSCSDACCHLCLRCSRPPKTSLSTPSHKPESRGGCEPAPGTAFPASAALPRAKPAAAQLRPRRAKMLKAGERETARDSTILFTGFRDREIGDSVLTLRSTTFHLL